jgi:hypothetical protein
MSQKQPFTPAEIERLSRFYGDRPDIARLIAEVRRLDPYLSGWYSREGEAAYFASDAPQVPA